MNRNTCASDGSHDVIYLLFDLAAKKAGLQQTFKHTQEGLTDKEKMKLNMWSSVQFREVIIGHLMGYLDLGI